jgi:hypothetical protein
MEYQRKLLAAKLLVTLAMAIYTLMPILNQVDWTFIANIFAFPVLMYAVWGKLHGTGRSVRLVAFLGMAYSVGYFISVAWMSNSGPDLYLELFAAIFALLTLGVLFSIRREKSLE